MRCEEAGGQLSLIAAFNNTNKDISDERLIYEYFDEQVRKTPDDVAVIFRDKQMTYAEVYQKSNRLANMLIHRGIGPNSIVGIILERSFEMIISIFGILKAGAAYLPIDPKHPKERVDYYISNSNVKVILTSTCYLDDNVNASVEYILWDSEKDMEQYSDETPATRANPDDLAYVIYTSGSTGVPKGVMIHHKALTNRLCWMIENFQLNKNDVFLQKTTYSFDVSVWELLCWGIVGAKLVIIEPDKEKNPREIVKMIEKHGVTILHFVPSVLELFLNYIEVKFDVNRIKSLNYVVVSGEELTLRTARKFNHLLLDSCQVALWNLYGPTEATIDVTSFDCSHIDENTDRIPIGKPVWNTTLYVFDEDMRLLPVGQKGELFIGGIQVAKGYLNNPELTQERFITNPLSEDEIIYKTGDIAKWNHHGEIEYYGRLDSQIKLRGLRIELGEIESKLMLMEQIDKAAVLLDTRSEDNKYLVAFYSSQKELDANLLISFLKKHIPEYMIPSKYVFVDAFKTTLNGKLDKRALLDMI